MTPHGPVQILPLFAHTPNSRAESPLMNQTPSPHRFRTAMLRSTICTASLIAILSVVACDSNSSTRHMTDRQQANAERLERQEAVRKQLERRYMVGPTSAAKINYKVKWQFPVPHRDIKSLTPGADSIFILTHNNDLIRVRNNDGRRVWTVSVANPMERIESITPHKSEGIVLVLSESSLSTLNIDTGMADEVAIDKAKQELQWVASTPGTLSGEYLLYGSPSGQLIWQAWRIGFAWQAYQVDHTLHRKPLVQGEIAVCAGPSGVIRAFTISKASQLWQSRLLDDIVAEPAANDQAVYIAGVDQHLRAFNLQTGRTLWRVLTTSPLTDDPILIHDKVYQQIPGEGLAAFTALPKNKLNGQREWINDTTNGSVVTQHGDRLVVWDPKAKVLGALSSGLGSTVAMMHLPEVDDVVTSGLISGDLYIIGNDGRVTALAPSN